MSKNNLDLWGKVCKTDPKHTKIVAKGQLRLTAINAQYQIKNATEQFGLYGKDWGLKNFQYDYHSVVDNQILAIVNAIFYYPDGEFEIGSSILMQAKTKNGLRVDSDFVKKIETDVLTKSLSKLGFNADVFEGRFDDNRYVAEMKNEFSEDDTKKLVDLSDADYKKKVATLNKKVVITKPAFHAGKSFLKSYDPNGKNVKALLKLMEEKVEKTPPPPAKKPATKTTKRLRNDRIS